MIHDSNEFFLQRLHFYDAEKMHGGALRVIEVEKDKIKGQLLSLGDWALTSCSLASELWYKAFERSGLEVKVMCGYYDPMFEILGEYTDDCSHIWLEVEGVLFDPTASQFSRFGDTCREFYYGENISISEIEEFENVRQKNSCLCNGIKRL